MFKELNDVELKEIKKAINTLIERRLIFKSCDKSLRYLNEASLAVDYKLLQAVLIEENIRKKNDKNLVL